MYHIDFNTHLDALETIIKKTTPAEQFEGNCIYFHNTFDRHPSLYAKQRNLEVASRHSDNAMEIGFNAGHSALIFLLGNRNLHLTCFDLGEHPYSRECFEYLSSNFPDRLSIIWGFSLETVLEYKVNHYNKKFGLIHIDGGHAEEIVRADIRNCALFANENTWMILDDISLPPIQHVYNQLVKTILIPVAGVFEETERWGHQLCRYRPFDTLLLTEEKGLATVKQCVEFYIDLRLGDLNQISRHLPLYNDIIYIKNGWISCPINQLLNRHPDILEIPNGIIVRNTPKTNRIFGLKSIDSS